MVRVKLPGLKQASQAQLNVTSQQLTVSVPGKYHLHLDLPYAVAEAEGSASFNPAKQRLEVTLPARPPKAPAMPIGLHLIQASGRLQMQALLHQALAQHQQLNCPRGKRTAASLLHKRPVRQDLVSWQQQQQVKVSAV